jgi:hypothetical protein
VYRLHATIFQGYRDWCRHVDLPERVAELTMDSLLKGGEAVVSSFSADESCCCRPCCCCCRRPYCCCCRRMTAAWLLTAI